jgi:hypothetical protein
MRLIILPIVGLSSTAIVLMCILGAFAFFGMMFLMKRSLSGYAWEFHMLVYFAVLSVLLYAVFVT